MQPIPAELIERVKALMIEEGVTLTDDLNQCEAAVYEFVQRLGTTVLQEHFSKKRSAMRGPAGPAPAERIRNS
jgi:hypothetical protein